MTSSKNSLSPQYRRLRPEERLKLIIAAGLRGDDVERDALVRSGGTTRLTFPDHGPHAQALMEVSQGVLLQLLDDASLYREAWHRADQLAADTDEPTDEQIDRYERANDIAMALGFQLKTRFAGWRSFCEQFEMPPEALWEHAPGVPRLLETVRMAERLSFTDEGFVRWLRRDAPNESEAAANRPTSLTAEKFAGDIDALYRRRLRWWRA